MKKPLVTLQNISKTFINADKQQLLVLENINFALYQGEIVALLGKSGSGKSTLLRIIANLIPPSSGQVLIHSAELTRKVGKIGMVFQNFALMPWLTVLENVELGLEAKGIPAKERRSRALEAIDMIGLDGFESAYPKELSGGMRQRVGFARALVIQSEILLMDEPFSALDVLTAETLRSDLLDLWNNGKTNIQSILCVTHNIEEAICMANRVVIFSNNPGKIKSIIPINLSFPCDEQSPEFRNVVDQIYTEMTTSERRRRMLVQNIQPQPISSELTNFTYRIPEIDASELSGLLEAMKSHETNGQIHLPDLSEDLHLDVNRMFQLTETLDMLQFCKISDKGEIALTTAGVKFAEVDILKRKQIFAKHLLNNIPLARHIRQTIEQQSSERVSEDFFLDQLGNHFSEDEAERILKTIIDWGRYAEIFAYDYDSGELSLENPQ